MGGYNIARLAPVGGGVGGAGCRRGKVEALGAAVGRLGGFLGMGGASSRDRKLQEASLPDEERYFGLENFGNTCYANSVLQVRRGCWRRLLVSEEACFKGSETFLRE